MLQDAESDKMKCKKKFDATQARSGLTFKADESVQIERATRPRSVTVPAAGIPVTAGLLRGFLLRFRWPCGHFFGPDNYYELMLLLNSRSFLVYMYLVQYMRACGFEVGEEIEGKEFLMPYGKSSKYRSIPLDEDLNTEN